MLNSYIFVIRKQNATRTCNVLFEFLYFGFLDPPIVDLVELVVRLVWLVVVEMVGLKATKWPTRKCS